MSLPFLFTKHRQTVSAVLPHALTAWLPVQACIASPYKYPTEASTSGKPLGCVYPGWVAGSPGTDRPARKVPISKVHHSMHTMNMLGMARRV